MTAVQNALRELHRNELSCKMTASLVAYLRKKGLDPAYIFKGLPFSEQYYCNASNWISEQEMMIIGNRSMDLANDDSLMYQVGLQLPFQISWDACRG
jgi:hypothetical protein